MGGGGRARQGGGKKCTNSYADFFLSLPLCLPTVGTPQKSYSHGEVKSACEKVHASDSNVHGSD